MGFGIEVHDLLEVSEVLIRELPIDDCESAPITEVLLYVFEGIFVRLLHLEIDWGLLVNDLGERAAQGDGSDAAVE